MPPCASSRKRSRKLDWLYVLFCSRSSFFAEQIDVSSGVNNLSCKHMKRKAGHLTRTTEILETKACTDFRSLQRLGGEQNGPDLGVEE